ncbi:MAG: carbohydrate ABC transporter permease [Candidatus Riflebacteria bacterium]|nr:carbohydrate ABC transporter permease [Candidatus Riflebacteria bacterium]
MTFVQRLTIHLVLIAGAVFMCFPFAWMVLTSLKDPKEILHPEVVLPRQRTYLKLKTSYDTVKEIEVQVLGRQSGGLRVRHVAGAMYGKEEVAQQADVITRRFHWQNYASAWSRGKGVTFTEYLANSFLVSAATTLGNLVTSLLAAYAFAFMNFPAKNALFALMLALMMVPQQVLLVPDFLIVKELGWYNSYWALIVPWTAGVFGIFLLRQFFLTLPRDLWEAALIDGCSRLGFLYRILVPLSVPPLVTLAIFSFLSTWNALIWPLVVVDRPELFTVQVGLASFTNEAGTRWELLMAASTISILPLVLMYFVAQRQFIEGIAGTGIKG